MKKHWVNRLGRISAVFLATGAFSGFFPLAPGTVGSIVGVYIVWLMGGMPVALFALVTIVLFFVGGLAANTTIHVLKKNDAPPIVIDEIVGVMVTLMGMPVSLYWLVCGLLIFRVFDVVKLPPAHYFDRQLRNGWGTMLDDVVAGIFGNIVLRLIAAAKF
ncbi:MAG: phosphatidylglycerophosphatase A [Deltaproteobacteria bacterium]|nr:phosphatidylglycerophosphatase A [Deltaproteobacteria bacterium]